MFCQSTGPVTWLSLLALAFTSTGCRSGGQVHDDRYRQMSCEYISAQKQPADADRALNPALEEFSGPHSVDDYVRAGLLQNPEISKARLMVESMANRVPQAASLPDPMLEMMTGVSHIQTAAGPQDFSLGMNQRIPWRGKLATSAAMAEQEVKVARAELAATELRVVEQIKNVYFQLYFVQQSIAITENDRKQLELIGDVVDQMYRVKREVTQQDVLQVQIALAQLDAEIVQLRQQKTSAQARLARLLHVSPETAPEALDRLPPEEIASDIHQLYEAAIQARPELHAQLAKIQQNRQASCQAKLDAYPDVTFGFNWVSIGSDGISPVANGDDAFMLTVGLNLPIYRNRIDAGIREAQTRALAESQEYSVLKDETMEGIADLFARISSLQETLSLFRENIIPKQQLTLDQSIDDYQVGKVDFLQLIDNWRMLLRNHIQEKRFEAELQQAIAALARQIGEFHLPDHFTTTQPQLETFAYERPDADVLTNTATSAN